MTAVAPKPAPASPASRSELTLRELDARSTTLGAKLEQTVAKTAMGIAGVAFVTLLSIKLSGRPIVEPNLWIGLGAFTWYAGELRLIRAGYYRSWFRYVSTSIENTLPSVVVLLDYLGEGAVSAYVSGGIPLYPLTIAASTLRLEPRLSLFAGALAALQFLAIFGWIAPPAEDPRLLGMFTATFHVTLIKAAYIFGVGIVSSVAAMAMARYLLRATQQAVEREHVRGLFSQYVSEEIVEEILAGKVKAGGERRRVTVLFADILGFTTLAESRPPEQLLRLLNVYFERMCGVVARHGGVVNKFIGDIMLVVFGAPNVVKDDARAALAAAREMVKEAEILARSGDFPGLKIAVGLHRGEAVAGNVGGSQRQEYTVIGDTVNTASRVEGIAKDGGRAIVLTGAVREALEAGGGPGVDELESLGTQDVRGRGTKVALFAPRLP